MKNFEVLLILLFPFLLSAYYCNNIWYQSPTVCSSRGICSSTNNCTCNSTFSGSDCQFATCFGFNSSSPLACSGNGLCNTTNTCVCNFGFSGNNCQNTACFGRNSTNPQVCSGQGNCTNVDTCTCKTGFIGLNCETPICFGVPANDTLSCGVNGNCTGLNTCTCRSNYTGSQCQFPICYGKNSTNACSRRGDCVSPNNCTCQEGYTGAECQFSICYGLSSNTSTVCSGRGSCLSPNNCTCNTGWTGDRCEIPICYGFNGTDRFVCSTRGSCVSPNNCSCQLGWGGITCAFQVGYRCFGVSEYNSSVCNNNGFCVADNRCTCFSGYGSADCGVKANPGCVWNNVSQSYSGFYPVLNNAMTSLTGSNLRIQFRVPVVTQRRNATIYIQSKANSSCIIPGLYGSNTIDQSYPCANVFDLVLSWGMASYCGWNVRDLGDSLSYNGTIYYEANENLGDIRGYPIVRRVTSGVPMLIKFMKRISFFTTIQLDSLMGLYSALISTLYIPGPPVVGQIEILTALQAPYVVNTTLPMTVISAPPGMTPTFTLIQNEGCANSQCIQRFRLSLAVSTACSFTGTYVIGFKVSCQSGTCEDQDSSISVQVDSEDFCTQTTIDIGLTGTQQSFSSSAFNTLQSQFKYDETAFFRVLTSSSQVALSTTRIMRVQWETSQTSKLLFSNFATTLDGQNQQFQTYGNGSTFATYGFKLDSRYMPVGTSNTTVFNISTVVEVRYIGFSGDYIRQFEVKDSYFYKDQTGQPQTTKYMTSISIVKEKETTRVTNLSSNIYLANILVFLLALMFF